MKGTNYMRNEPIQTQSDLSPTLTFDTAYLGKIVIQTSLVLRWSTGCDIFNNLDHAGRQEQRVCVELKDGTILYGATNKVVFSKRRRKKNWRHC